MNKIEELNNRFGKSTAGEILDYFLAEYKGKIALASSMGLEDQVLTDLVLNTDREATIFTIDTGRLFPETYSLIDRTNLKYNIRMKVYSPDSSSLEPFVHTHGINPFYESIEKRKNCCRIRKIEPLLRALSGLEVWICGLRQEQATTRTGIRVVEWDEANGLIKLNPLAYWTEREVLDYIRTHSIPYNKLHDKGFPSIGCQPCTRAVKEGEDIRAGRWWWENPEQKECGLHKR